MSHELAPRSPAARTGALAPGRARAAARVTVRVIVQVLRGVRRAAVAVAMAGLAWACTRSPEPAQTEAPIRLWHTFNPAETEALNRALAGWPRPPVQTTLIPFSRGQTMLQRVLQSGRDCPDLARVDATWLPGLVAADLVQPVPEAQAAARQWLPEAVELAMAGDRLHGLPQSMDGLAIIYREDAVAGLPWPPRTMDELVATARQLTGPGRHGLGVHADGYWFVPFLRAWAQDPLPAVATRMSEPAPGDAGPTAEVAAPAAALPAASIDTPQAAEALARFAALFGPGGVAPPMAPSGNAARDQTRQFRTGTLAMVIDGPWSISELTQGTTHGIGVAALPEAPRGGQLFVVPRCAANSAGAWDLAVFLTAPLQQAEWAQRLGVIPTTQEALNSAGPFVGQFYQALRSARPLPRHPVTAELFDDLNPAVHAVVAGDATPAEALAGVARGWRRLVRRHGSQPATATGGHTAADAGAPLAPPALTPEAPR